MDRLVRVARLASVIAVNRQRVPHILCLSPRLAIIAAALPNMYVINADVDINYSDDEKPDCTVTPISVSPSFAKGAEYIVRINIVDGGNVATFYASVRRVEDRVEARPPRSIGVTNERYTRILETVANLVEDLLLYFIL